MAARLSTVEEPPNPFHAALVESAQDAGLQYTGDDREGILRKRREKGFVYICPNGERVKNAGVLARIKGLVIPPAWTDVWISPHANGHLQATGRDARGRKQYRYHPHWREVCDENKFGRMMAFARALPRIRRRVRRDLSRRGMPHEKVLATVVRLLEASLIRVGNDEYARQNHSYGLTTMRNRHARVVGEKIHFTFPGKSGKRHEIDVRDPQLARIVRRCQDIPGQELFGYEDEEGRPHKISSQDVNAYLREIAGDDFTAKDFRTWAGTVLAAVALREFEAVTHPAEVKKNVAAAIEAVARMLGNTPAICRKCYVHPEIIEAYLLGDTIATNHRRKSGKIKRAFSQLKPEEAAVLVLLQRRLKRPRNRKSAPKLTS